MSGSFAKAILIIALSLSPYWVEGAESRDYNRMVQLEWEDIPGADRYEIELVRGTDCSGEPEVDKTAKPTWRRSLAAGIYCSRVRGVNAGEIAGEWTEFRRMEVPPKPPKGVRREGEGRFSWDQVPYAKKYEIEVLDPTGKTVHRAQVNQPEFALPESVTINPYFVKNQEFKVTVKTVVDGLAPSSARRMSFRTTHPPPTPPPAKAESVVARKPDLPMGNLPPPTLDKSALDSRAADEALLQYRLTGERPFPPSKAEWARASNPKVREELRRRAIASARIDMEEKMERARFPDLRFSAGTGFGSHRFFGNIESGMPSSDSDGSGFSAHMSARLYRNRPWGGVAQLSWQTFQDQDQIAKKFSSFSIAGERNFGFNGGWDTVFTLRAGLEYSEHPAAGSESNGRRFSYPLTTVGGRLGTSFRFRFHSWWEWDNSIDLRIAPSQGSIGGLVNGLSMQGVQIATGPAYGITNEFEVRAQLMVSGSRAEANNGTLNSTLVATEALLQGVYRLNPEWSRSPASQKLMLSERGQLWDARIFSPLARRSYATFSTSPSNAAANSAENLIKASASFRRAWRDDSPWRLGAELTLGGDNRELDLQAGYEIPLTPRRDVSLVLLGGIDLSRNSGLHEGEYFSLGSIGTDLGFELRQRWGTKWLSEFAFGLGLPLMVSSEDGLGLGADAQTVSDGFNYSWNGGALFGYRVHESVTIWSGARYLRLRQSIRTYTSDENVEARLLSFSEMQVRLGIGWRF